MKRIAAMVFAYFLGNMAGRAAAGGNDDNAAADSAADAAPPEPQEFFLVDGEYVDAESAGWDPALDGVAYGAMDNGEMAADADLLARAEEITEYFFGEDALIEDALNEYQSGESGFADWAAEGFEPEFVEDADIVEGLTERDIVDLFLGQ